MDVHLVDGTYELFRHHYGGAAAGREEGDRFAGTRGVMGSVLQLVEEGATHVGVATDHVIESFRNDMWPGYKSSMGMPPELLDQFGLLEEGLAALGFKVWPMVELEADDALAAAAAAAAADPRVDQVQIMTPDKDLAQCVQGRRVVQVDRRQGVTTDEDGVRARYGIGPESVPDWLALVGDSADGFPGLAGWGKKAASAVLARYPHIEDIPELALRWEGVDVRGRERLAATLAEQRELALLFRDLATLRADAPVLADVDELRWTGPTPALAAIAAQVNGPRLVERAARASR
ncbi:MAG: 5'-3' exonuclease H3TH domain-containing protein [Actinomycetota bacterium]